jgi:hypothetical protein
MKEQFIVAFLLYMLVLGSLLVVSNLSNIPSITPRIKTIIGKRYNISVMLITIMIYYTFSRNGP